MDDDNNNNNNKMMRKSNNGQMSQLSRVSVAQISESDSEVCIWFCETAFLELFFLVFQEELVGETVENVDIEVNGKIKRFASFLLDIFVLNLFFSRSLARRQR